MSLSPARSADGGAEALARLAEIPPAGSEERLFWLEAAERHGFYKRWPSTPYVATPDDVLSLMSEARKQGQRDVLAPAPTAGGSTGGGDFVLVPREPTWGLYAMSGAGAEVIPASVGRGEAGRMACDIYRAMVAAAPAPATPDPQPETEGETGRDPTRGSGHSRAEPFGLGPKACDE